ncbi:MAG: Thiamine-monophosphate kinase [Verrucomicrobia subdivision 3 bacterium]|nr:Thiamine-monophosphate kinase [Limisphaerales bacterium]MCS1413526.1 Thiamine-monophosphate kinase [Limisphaerales bacterium]
MGEREIVEALARTLPSNENTVIGAGDDCASVRLPKEGRTLLLKTDAVVEGVHFSSEDPPQLVGRKALARCLSDIAAMGGAPDSALITLGVPADRDHSFLMKLYEGLNALAVKYDVAIVGGETTRCPGGLFISVALTGYAGPEGGIQRAGSLVGDAIFVSGQLGGSLSGQHLEFEPRVNESRWLVEHFMPHAMIDVSDGLGMDLGHLLRAGGVGALVDESFIPVSRAAKIRARDKVSDKSPLLAALTDGEDFELLFTVASSDAVAVKDGWQAEFPDLPLSLIGQIESDSGLRLKGRNGIRSIDGIYGYDHFE